MKVSGEMTREMVAAWSGIPMEIGMKVTFKMGSRMEMACTPGLMVRFTRVSGRWV